MCVHGLTRNGRDFDLLAAALEDRFRIVCPDVVGRGRSDWLSRASAYAQPQYMDAMTVMLARLGLADTDLLRTTTAGLTGQRLTVPPWGPPRSIIVNAACPFLPIEQ